MNEISEISLNLNFELIKRTQQPSKFCLRPIFFFYSGKITAHFYTRMHNVNDVNVNVKVSGEAAPV
jgi:hypothetical protein